MMNQTASNWEGQIAFLFQPDTVISAQYLETFRRKTLLEPEKRLMLTILEDAIACFQNHISTREGKGKKHIP